MSAKVKSLGIIAMCKGPTFTDKAYYKRLTLIGRRLGIRVFVFSPREVNFEQREVVGYEYRQGAWKKGVFPLPKTIYDRCFISPSYRHYKPFVEKLQNDPEITFLGHGLSGKWMVHQMLSQSPTLAKWLPETHIFSFPTLFTTLETHPAAVIKPVAGTHGLSVVKIAMRQGKFVVTGRNRQNQPFQRIFLKNGDLKRFLASFTAGRRFLVQPYLPLHTPDGSPYDVRVLVQKNGLGQWQTTGMAVRVGNKNGITSNLHGGGRAVPLSTFLSCHFRLAQRVKIERDIEQLVEQLPSFLEETHGRLFELGIDIGIDMNGIVWIIEVNSRPGRTVFRQIEDRRAQIQSVSQPVNYAHYLMKSV